MSESVIYFFALYIDEVLRYNGYLHCVSHDIFPGPRHSATVVSQALVWDHCLWPHGLFYEKHVVLRLNQA